MTEQLLSYKPGTGWTLGRRDRMMLRADNAGGHLVSDAIPRSRSHRRIGAVVLTAVATLTVAAIWAEIGYRLLLFFGDYKSQIGMNHVDDAWFGARYIGAALAAYTAICAAFVVRGRLAKVLMALLAAAAAFACITIHAMHRAGVLVTYGEWAHLHGG